MSDEEKFGFAFVGGVVALLVAAFAIVQGVSALSTLPWWVNTAGSVAYLLLGLTAGRVANRMEATTRATVAVAVFWPVVLLGAIIYGIGRGLGWVMMHPTKRERLDQRLAELEAAEAAARADQ